MLPTFQMQFAGVPFCTDRAFVVRKHDRAAVGEVKPPIEQSALRKQQPLVDLIDEINRLMPWDMLDDFDLPSDFPGYAVSQLARKQTIGDNPTAKLRLGEWYYPNGASRWSVFRYLATSTMAKQMLAATNNCTIAEQFIMQQVPVTPNQQDDYLLETLMFMLPPRCINELGGVPVDGLYLITLVDERYYWGDSPATLQVNTSTTWTSLLSQLFTILDAPVSMPTIPSVYGQPQPDSQLWTNAESAAALVDTVCHNIGRVAVRNLDGTYSLLTPWESKTRADSNRSGIITRTAGGNIFQSVTDLPAGNLTGSKNAVAPTSIVVSFPKYIVGNNPGNDPIPHFYNPRYNTSGMRPSSWFEEGFGDTYQIIVPIASGAPLQSGFSTSTESGLTGLTGQSQQYIHDTLKALYTTESLASGALNNPNNVATLQALALQIAQDRYAELVIAALDETYPGTVVLDPEGLHDIIWTYSESRRLACTRVLRTQWNNPVRDMQHEAIGSTTPTGVGGRSVAQTWHDMSGNMVFGVNAVKVMSGLTMSGGLSEQGIQEVLLGLTSGCCGSTQNLTFINSGSIWSGVFQVTTQSGIIVTSGTSGGVISIGFGSTVSGANTTQNFSFIQGLSGSPIWSGVVEVTAQSGLQIDSGSATGKIKLGMNFSGSSIHVTELVFDYTNITLTSGYANSGLSASGISKLVLTPNIFGVGGAAIQTILGGTPGQLLYIENIGANPLALVPGGNIKTPLGTTYSIWSLDGVTIQYDGTNWRFDNPTFGAGSILSGLLTYSCDALYAGSGLGSVDNGNGTNSFYTLAPSVNKNFIGVQVALSGAHFTVSGFLASGTAGGSVSIYQAIGFTGISGYASGNNRLYDTGLFFSSGIYDRLTIPKTGWYQTDVFVRFNSLSSTCSGTFIQADMKLGVTLNSLSGIGVILTDQVFQYAPNTQTFPGGSSTPDGPILRINSPIFVNSGDYLGLAAQGAFVPVNASGGAGAQIGDFWFAVTQLGSG